MIINRCISNTYLFDGYLTERPSYPQWQAWPYLTGAPDEQVQKVLKPCASAASLFDGYLTTEK